MIIVSQDKRNVLNFDFTQRIGLDRETNFSSIMAYQNAKAECMWLGSYKTEERAKEVLQEIITSYRDYRTAECDGYTNVLQETAVFEMPIN